MHTVSKWLGEWFVVTGCLGQSNHSTCMVGSRACYLLHKCAVYSSFRLLGVNAGGDVIGCNGRRSEWFMWVSGASS
jgi:hypothetical protein